jgi:hypothetical protein
VAEVVLLDELFLLDEQAPKAIATASTLRAATVFRADIT